MQDVPYGYCRCGCGEKTSPAGKTDRAQGWIKGEPVRYIKGHSGHKFGPGETAKTERWLVEDRGYSTPCWIWQLYRCPRTRYGKLLADGRTQLAHRYYFEQKNGALPQRVKLDHLCRVRHCVNPAHLEPTTNAENCRRGNNTKLTAEDVREIRSLCAQGWHQADIGRAYRVTQANVSEIHRRKSWADLDEQVQLKSRLVAA